MLRMLNRQLIISSFKYTPPSSPFSLLQTGSIHLYCNSEEYARPCCAGQHTIPAKGKVIPLQARCGPEGG